MLVTRPNVSVLDPQEQGAFPPPLGITPNFVNPSSIATGFQAGFGVCVGISGLFVIARTYTRICVMKRWGLEDYFMWLSWAFSVVYIIMGYWAMPYGAGVHQWNVNVVTHLEFLKHWYIPMILYNPAICFIKLAIVIQFFNIFAPARTTRNYWAFTSLMIVIVIFYIVCSFLRVFQCTPREKIWNPKIQGTCLRMQTTFIASASLNVILDFIMFLVPIKTVWQLQMSKERKWAITVVFGTGFLGCIASVMRLITSVHFSLTKDDTYELLLEGVWCEVEIASGLICYCLQVFPKLYRERIKKLFSASSTSHAHSHRSIFPTPSSYKRHFDFHESANAENENSDLPRHLGINKTVVEVCAPSHDWNYELESGQIRRTTSVSQSSFVRDMEEPQA